MKFRLRTVSRFSVFLGWSQYHGLGKGLVKCHMSASQVLNAPTYQFGSKPPNDALQDHNFCNQCTSWKLIALNVLLKTFTQLMDARKSRFAPNTPDPLCAKGTRHLIRFARNGSIQRSPHPWHRLSFKFGIFICDRISNTC